MSKDVSTKVGALKIREHKDDRTGEIYFTLAGVFETLRFAVAISIEPLQRDANAPAPTKDTPTHRVLLAERGRTAELGVAWERQIERGDYIGRPMFSIALNHPEMPDWAGNMAAFPRGNAGNYEIVYQRRRQQPIPADDQGSAGADRAGEDDIPEEYR